MQNTREPLVNDCIDRGSQHRNEVLELLKASKLSPTKTVEISEETLSGLWAYLGNALYELSQTNNELNGMIELINLTE